MNYMTIIYKRDSIYVLVEVLSVNNYEYNSFNVGDTIK